MRWFPIIILFLFGKNVIFSQVDSLFVHLEGQVEKLNNQSNFEGSLRLIDSFENVNTSVESKFYSNLFRSYVYKRIFDYKLNTAYLDKAILYGKQSPDSNFLSQIILAQKSMASFDTRNFELATKYMDSIRINGIELLSLEDQGKILMQEAYIVFLNGNYNLCKELLYKSLLLIEQSTPQHKPMVYGKLLEVYGSEKNVEKVDEIAAKALACAKEFGIVKYEIYIHSELEKTYKKLGLMEKAYHSLKRKSELEGLYNEKENKLRFYLHTKDDSVIDGIEKDDMIFKLMSFLSVALLGLSIYFFFKGRSQVINRNEQVEEPVLDDVHVSEEDIIYETESEIPLTTETAPEFTESSPEEVDVSESKPISFEDVLLEKGLSQRQIEIMQLFINGDSKKIIASKLIISENTVKYHIKEIYHKLEVTNKSELIVYAQKY